MRLLFIQLPLMDHGHHYVLGNIPYATSTLAAYLKKNFNSSIQIDHLPSVIAHFGSNGIIERYITSTAPDCICFTSYLWNVERNLSIIRNVREKLTDVKIIMGGPEIVPGSWVLNKNRDEVDVFVVGEGEWFFSCYMCGSTQWLHHTMINGNRVFIQPQEELLPVEKIVEPVLNRHLHPMIDGSLFYEMTRGCPYRCTYCYYSKNCKTVRELPFEHLLDFLDSKYQFELKEIYLLSPTFNITPGFHDKLKELALRNNGIELHTEMRTENIDRKTALLLHEAGFRSLEVGLQTITEKSRKKIKRTGRVEEELQGMEFLKEAGIDLKIGIIPGLPGDSPEGFQKTVDHLTERGFAENIELYPLMLLPGTAIRDHGDRSEVQYQHKPPYFLKKGWGFNFNDIQNLINETEKTTGLTHNIRRLPDFCVEEKNGLVSGISFWADSIAAWDGKRFAQHIDTAVFTFFINLIYPQMLADGLQVLFNGLPTEHQLYHIVFSTDELLNESVISTFLMNSDRDSFQRRIHLYSEWENGFSIRAYQLFKSSEKFIIAEKKYELITPVFRIDRVNAAILDFYPSDDPPDVVIAEGEFGFIKNIITERYRDCNERISFENKKEKKDFYRSAEIEYIEWPYNFTIMKFKNS